MIPEPTYHTCGTANSLSEQSTAVADPPRSLPDTRLPLQYMQA